MADLKPTLSKPMSTQSKNYETNFKATMSKNNIHLHESNDFLIEIDNKLDNDKFSIKKKIFSLPKMESLVFSDPLLSTKYNEMSEEGSNRWGYHYNETVMNILFNDYVLNSPKYLQKYKQAIPKEKKRRDKSGINQLKKAGEEKMNVPTKSVQEKFDVDESTTASSAGGAAGYVGYAGPSAWSKKGELSGDFKKKKETPIANISTISESQYLIDPSGFEKYIQSLNEADTSVIRNKIQEQNDADYIQKNSEAFGSEANNMNQSNKDIIVKDLKTGVLDRGNNIKETDKTNTPLYERFESKKQQRYFYYKANDNSLPAEERAKWKKMAQEFSDKTNFNKLPEKVDEGNNRINPKYTHFAIYKPNGKIINGWEYAGYDSEELKMEKKHYFFNDIVDMDFNPKDVNILTTKSLQKRGINPFDNNNWYVERFNPKEQINNIKEDSQTMIKDNGSSMANKQQPIGDLGSNASMGMQSSGGMNEVESLFETLNNELEAFAIHQNKLKVIAEDRKPSALVLRDRLGAENEKNFKSDMKNSDTQEIINIEKELQYKDQQTNVGNKPDKLGIDIEKKAIKTGDMNGEESFKNVGDSTNDKGNEIPKRNLTSDEQEEVNMYRNGMHSLVYDNEPSERFEDRMKADMGDNVYDIRQKQMDFKAKAPMYNKDTQPTENGIDKSQFDKNESGWNKREGLKESLITGRYFNNLGKRRLVEFKVSEVENIEKIDESKFSKINFDGLGNSYYSKTIDNKVVINESVVNALKNNEYYTDGNKIVATKKTTLKLNENTQSIEKPVMNEQINKMKHLLGYKPESYVSTNNVKNNRGF
jgi:hypothetical protein